MLLVPGLYEVAVRVPTGLTPLYGIVRTRAFRCHEPVVSSSGCRLQKPPSYSSAVPNIRCVFSSAACQDDPHGRRGLSNDEIARRLDTRRDVVWMWRKRFFSERLAGLEERARPDRPRTFPPELVVQVKAWLVNCHGSIMCRCLVGVQLTWRGKFVKPVWWRPSGCDPPLVSPELDLPQESRLG